MVKKISILAITVSNLFFGLSPLSAQMSGYSLAKEAAISGDRDFALLHYYCVLDEDANKEHRETALLAICEYFLLAGDSLDAFNSLNEFIAKFPDSEKRPLALFLLLKVSQIRKDNTLAQLATKHIINLKRVILLFKDTQEYKFRSPLGLDYKIVYSIDRIEFYLDGKLEGQVAY